MVIVTQLHGETKYDFIHFDLEMISWKSAENIGFHLFNM